MLLAPHLGFGLTRAGVKTPVKWRSPPSGTGRATMRAEKISLADQIRDKLDAGRLPSVLPEKMLTGYGQASPCNGCSQPIHPPQIEYHFHLGSGDVIRLHIGCMGMWLAELRRRGLLKQNDML
jgi:hypothetical protein